MSFSDRPSLVVVAEDKPSLEKQLYLLVLDTIPPRQAPGMLEQTHQDIAVCLQELREIDHRFDFSEFCSRRFGDYKLENLADVAAKMNVDEYLEAKMNKMQLELAKFRQDHRKRFSSELPAKMPSSYEEWDSLFDWMRGV